jgi:hypothetical protein
MEGYDYAKCIEISKRVRWDMDKDVIRCREFDLSQKFLPDGLSKVDQFHGRQSPRVPHGGDECLYHKYIRFGRTV